MSELLPHDGKSAHVPPPIRLVRRASSIDVMPVMESPSYRIQRWIGCQDLYPATTMSISDSEEAWAHHFAEVDWELEEFEREMALRFVMRDLQLGLEERRARTSTSSRSHDDMTYDTPYDMDTITRADSERRKRSQNPWLRTQSSSATLQPLTRPAKHQPSSPPPQSESPEQSSFPSTPRTSRSAVAPPPTSATPELSSRSLRTDSLIRLLGAPSRVHKPSPSVVSLSSHFSSCTSSASVSVDTDADTDAGPNASTRSVVSQLGHKIKHGFLPSSAPSPYAQYRQKTPPTFTELTPPGTMSRRRRITVPVPLASKKRRLIVRGLKMDDDYGVEGIRRWANGLGEVSRMYRAQDGTIWIEFRDKRVAESVCCLQAQVQIPRVGRVILDWAEGRHPG